MSIILVPTPSCATGSFSLEQVLTVAESIGRAMRGLKRYHLVIVSSTVSPGSMQGPIKTILEARSGKDLGSDFGLCYSPQFVSLGSVVADLRRPDLVLIGESDPVAGDLLAALYRAICTNDPPIARTTFSNAELIKLGVNTFVTARMSFANMLSHLCDRLPGADMGVVSSVLSLDSRIGSGYLHGGLPYGGPCFPRDNRALAATAAALGAVTRLPQAIDEVNQSALAWLAESVRCHIPPGHTVGILGLSYKAETDVVDASAGVSLANCLAAALGERVYAHDPRAMENACGSLAPAVQLCRSATECVDISDVVVVVIPWEEYQALPGEAWAGRGRSRVVVDCWRALPWLEQADGVQYVVLGRGPDATAS